MFQELENENSFIINTMQYYKPEEEPILQQKTYTIQSQQINPTTPQVPPKQPHLQQIGPFVFNSSKLQLLLQDQKIKILYENQQWFKNQPQEIILKNIPPNLLLAVDIYFGKFFKYSDNQELNLICQVEKHKVNLTLQINISHVNFPNLKVLNLSKLGITSIEPLTFINAPKIISLQLYGNQIYTMEPLLKADFKGLRIITFYHNPVAKMDQFYRIHNKKLNKYEFDNNRNAKILMQDYRFMFKMENTNFKTLNLKDPERINLKGSKVYKKLKKQGTTIIFDMNKQQNIRMKRIRLTTD